jgi:hypothetical protein
MNPARGVLLERIQQRERALEEAQLLAQLAHSKGQKYDPAADFPPELLRTGTASDSDFSIAAITRLIDRNQRLNQARGYAKARVNPKSAAQMPAAA